MSRTQAHPGPAQDALLRIIALVNTRCPDGDEIATPQALSGWLGAHGMVPAGVSATGEQHARALVVREGLRAMLAENNRIPGSARPLASGRPDGLDPLALSRLAALARDLPLLLDVTSSPPRLVPAANGTVDGALATVLAAVADAAASGTWPRMKTCREPSCRWAYYDQSRNRSRAWCSMNVCGNRSKARTFRRHGAVPAAGRRAADPAQADGGFTPNM